MDKSLKKRFSPIPVVTEEIGKKVLDPAYAVHSALGPGLLDPFMRLAWRINSANRRRR